MRPVDVPDLVDGVLAGSRQHVARAITLLESSRPDHRERASELLAALSDRTGGAVRVGVSGVPGAGKSTFIDAMGVRLIEQGHRVAVVAVDPGYTATDLNARSGRQTVTEGTDAIVAACTAPSTPALFFDRFGPVGW